MRTIKIPMITLWIDGGDGGGGISIYNTLEESR